RNKDRSPWGRVASRLLWSHAGGAKVKATTLIKGFLSCVVALALVGMVGAITPAFATGVVCGSLCRATVSFSGVSLNAPITINQNGVGTVSNFSVKLGGVTARINSATLNPDPAILFSASATNLTGAPVLFTFTFIEPIALAGTISAASSIGYTLTDGFQAGLGGAPGVALTPGVGTDTNHVIVANDTITLHHAIHAGLLLMGSGLLGLVGGWRRYSARA